MAHPPWRLILGGPDGASADATPATFPGTCNMAVDQALLESVADGAAAVLRLYRWRPACLSFGRNQPAAGIYDPERAHALGIDVVRRPTGGLGVLHDAELTYAVVVPARVLGGPRATYRTINRALAAGLRTLGVAAEIAGEAVAEPAPSLAAAAPCFVQAAPGEVVVSGRKLVGSAQRVERRTILQHGSILLDGTQARVQQLRIASPGADPGVAATSIREELGALPCWEELTRAFVAAWERLVGTALARAALEPAERARARALEAWFADPAWTWRR